MIVQVSQTGTRQSISVLSKRIEMQILDGARWSHKSMSMVQISTSQHQSEAPQPVCAATAMMHGMPMAPASSVHGGCPSIAEHQEFAPCMPPPGMTMMQRDVITPNPGYKIPANLWDFNIAHCAHAPSPLATFIRHCNSMESPYYPTYSKQGTLAPADSMM